ncbi:hypothetical protein [Nitratireductor indicus]|uniref:hypothetical protein n=1 Tax=Nitratireductor indicus TaxID=721133 RepID=UPI0028751701|nr:hypothetical protein [Nitratireductor indicus]MDS1138579.1 hypothetical protein [Nitratireductor indicus]
MCFFALPALGGLSGILQGIGAVASAGASIAGGISANNVAQYNAKVAENNAISERERASYDADLTRQRVRQTMGAQRAAAAASGLDTSSGTPVAVLGDTAGQGEMDVLARLYSGEAAATAYQNDAQRFRAEGKAQRSAGFINAGTSLLSNFGSMAARRYQPLGR